MSLLKQLGSVMSDGFGTVEEVGAGDVSGFMDSGSYSLNALACGSIYGGFPTNKITGFVGEKSTGKTFFIVRGIKGFLEQYQNGEVIILDTEFAITSEQLKAQGCDVSRIAWEPVATVEEFRTKVMQVLGIYRESIKDHLKKHKKAPPPQLMFVLDSIGGLSTNKEVEDIKEGNDKRDMTKQQLLKGAFRVITIECGKLNVPILVTGHTYAAIGCLDGLTPIFMFDGSSKLISEIQVGDEVLTTSGVGRVEETFKYENAECFEFEFDNGEKVICTKDHKFLAQNLEWKSAEELQEDDVVMFVPVDSFGR